MVDPIYKLEAVSVSIEQLEAAWNRKDAATKDFKVLCDSVAEKSGLEPTALATYVNARMRDKVEEHTRKAEQLSLLLEMA
jgi:hypothetical protein